MNFTHPTSTLVDFLRKSYTNIYERQRYVECRHVALGKEIRRG